MFKIVFITSMFDNMYSLNKVCNSIKSSYPNKFDFEFFTATDIDSSNNIYNNLINSIAKSDFICMMLHGGVSNFKSFLKMKKRFEKIKPFFIHSTIEDETREFTKILESLLSFMISLHNIIFLEEKRTIKI